MPSPLVNNEGLFRISGMWGEARDLAGSLLAEVTECSATAERARIDVPIVGTDSQHHKPGRITREGTFRVQKIDDKWELEVYRSISASIADRRAARGTTTPLLRPFELLVGYDDPEALGESKWQLDGCLLWRLPLGFNIGDDIRDLEFPFTYEKETPLKAYHRDGTTNASTGLPNIVYDYDTAVASGA